MGSNLGKRIGGRAAVIKVLSILPDWFFGRSTRRIYINPMVLQRNVYRYEVLNDGHNYEDDYDDDDDGCCKCEALSPVLVEMQLIHEEVRAQQLDTVEGVRKQLAPAPSPPPMMMEECVATGGSLKPASMPRGLLEDITNVRLKPVRQVRGPVDRRRTDDIRNDLHAVLMRRFAVMHSPCSSRQKREEDDASDSFNDSSTFQTLFVM